MHERVAMEIQFFYVSAISQRLVRYENSICARFFKYKYLISTSKGIFGTHCTLFNPQVVKAL